MRVFCDEKLQEQFERDGYVIVDFYNAEQIKELDNLYHQLHPVDEKGFFPSTFSQDVNYRETVNREIQRIGSKWINENLQDIKTMFGAFIVKYPGPDSAMNVHQDMTLVDERKYTGINIWCPLIDLDDENGVLQALRGSHRIVPTYRGSTVAGLYDDVQNEIQDYLEPIYLKAGQAIIFDQSIIHYSAANVSDKIRITTNIYFTHKEAEFKICYWEKDFGNKVEVFEQDETFMTNFKQFGDNIYARPTMGKSLGLVDYDFPKLTPEWLEKLYGKRNRKNAKQLFQDEALQKKFDTEGFVKIPFLSKQEVNELLEIFYELHPNLSAMGFQSSSYSSNFAYKKKCSDSIAPIFEKKFVRLLKNYRSFGSAFLFKQPDTYSELPVHQDWTIVDEENYVALNIWVPLCDTDETNGTLYVLPGSQYGVVKALRCPTVPMFFEGNEQLMIDNCIPMNAKAGEAVILNQSIVHYSPPNKSDKIRVAITSGAMSAEPKMVFHYRSPEMKDEIERIEMGDDFLLSWENFMEAIYQRPRMGKSIGTKKYTAPVYSKEELQEFIIEMKKKSGFDFSAFENEMAKNISIGNQMTETEVKPKSIFKKIVEALGL